ncbi:MULTISPECIES: carbohydrate ABC transporter permease [Haloferacaceae]|uniref:Carbohydrate ABC transporter permease n=1 Tax=Halorubrum glutamatedens TaxID=2707018 RepID=A0ABD5QQX4_9EURY|nr:carbohydrate ABC transporter permease [Halobellus captivus]
MIGLIASAQATTGDLLTSVRESLTRANRKYTVAAILAVLLGLFWVSPLWGGISTAFKTQSAFINTIPLSPPPAGEVTIQPWLRAWETLSPSLGNSLIFTLPAMVFSGVLGSLAAYGLTMVDWRGQVAVMATFIVAIFLPKQGILLPLSRFWNAVDLQGILSSLGYFSLPFAHQSHTTLLILIITHTAYGIGICTLLFRGYYLTIDHDLVEAARIDGAGVFSIYRNIILPLSYPMFMVVFIFQFTQIYNEFLYALILVGGSDPSAGAPITLALAELNSGFSQNWNNQMAGAFITAVPTLIVYVLFGEQFAKGVKY